ncbi:MAG: hypothetical protein H6935_04910 [Thiobacillus sp.]|nr:hypothetical protein [Thiobacillus sp.]
MKRITTQNWLEPDATGPAAGMEARAWRDTFLSIRLDRKVPGEVAAQFETARASMMYGLFFAPLVALGVEQCYWVLEAGLRARCAQLDLPVSVQDRQGRDHALSFHHNLRQLLEKGLVSEEDALLWKQAGELKAWLALPRHGEVVARDHALTALTRAATLLNALFA